MQDNAQVLGFTAGELSPWLSSRYDLQAYQRGAARLENFLVQPYGGLRRRPGTAYVADAASQDADAVRLIPFSFSESDVLMLEFYPGKFRVYKDGACLQKDGAPYTVDTPWTSAELIASLRCTQVNDIIYVTCPAYRPMMIMRLGDTNWRVTVMNMDPYPRETYLSQSAGLKVMMETDGNNAELIVDSGEPFSADMVNQEYIIAEAPIKGKTLFLNETMGITSTPTPDLSTTSRILKGTVCHVANSSTGMSEFYTCIRTYYSDYYNGSEHPRDYPTFFLPGFLRLSNASPYEVCGEWELRTSGEWDGQWELWRSYDSPVKTTDFYQWDWACIKSFGQDAYSTRQNWALTGSEDTPCRMVIVCRAFKGNGVAPIMYFRTLGGTREYRFQITRFNSASSVRGKNMTIYSERPASFYTKNWSFGAFGVRNGYPRFAGMHQGRLWLGGAAGMPTTLFASCVGDYGNFSVTSADDSALHLTLATDDQSRICWICPMRNLLVGTSESEWTLSAPDGGNITPSNASFSRQSAVGSENKVAYGVENSVFYVQRGGKRLREISYKLEADGYTSTDASILAEHLFAAGVKEWVVQRGNCMHVWALMYDGSIAVLTTNPEQQVIAWQRASFPGRRVVCMASIAHIGDSEDEIWFAIRNEKSGKITIERIADESLFLDGTRELVAHEGESLYAGDHLAGLSAYIHPVGQPEKASRVSIDAQGYCTPTQLAPGSVYRIGAGFESYLQTMPFEKPESFNAVQQIGRVKLRLHNSSVQFAFKGEAADLWEIYEPQRDQLPPVYTGAIRLSFIPSPGVGRGFCLRADGAQDFALISMTVDVDFHGR